MKRVPTGVTGFDELIQGGMPEGATVLVSGGCGSENYFCNNIYL